MTPRFASIARGLPNYRNRHRKLRRFQSRPRAQLSREAGFRRRATARGAPSLKFARDQATTIRPREIIVGPIVAGKWSASAVNEIRLITTPAYWGGVTDECRFGAPADSDVRRVMEVVAGGIGRRSGSAWAARERAADDWHRG